MMRGSFTVVLALAITAARAADDAREAHANIWQDALEQASPDAAKATYDKELREGDEHVLIANAENASLPVRKQQVQLALQSYRNAAAALPQEATPYFRIAAVLHSFYLEACDEPRLGTTGSPLRDCRNRKHFNAVVGKQVVDALYAAEARAPLDPRWAADSGESLIFTRALLLTRLATPATWEAAVRDYKLYLSRADGSDRGTENAWSNLAETYMMLGRLDDALDAYREIRDYPDVSTTYGAAVALDRSERGDLAQALIVRQGKQGYELFRQLVNLDLTFFVPAGEEYYYFALVEQAWGNYDAALSAWRQYIASGAHPQFHGRAKQHIDMLITKQRARATPPFDPFMDLR
ncbi:MAG: hypothetical protein H0X17_14905 [Deltaproteobacteria bacterium]|nr:hypothetical protein [Deltaproteobacteria bacterium]